MCKHLPSVPASTPKRPFHPNICCRAGWASIPLRIKGRGLSIVALILKDSFLVKLYTLSCWYGVATRECETAKSLTMNPSRLETVEPHRFHEYPFHERIFRCHGTWWRAWRCFYLLQQCRDKRSVGKYVLDELNGKLVHCQTQKI